MDLPVTHFSIIFVSLHAYLECNGNDGRKTDGSQYGRSGKKIP